MLIRSLVVASLVGVASLAANIAVAYDGASSVAAFDGVSFSDPSDDFSRGRGGPAINLSVGEADAPRFLSFGRTRDDSSDRDSSRGYQVALGANGFAGLPVDVSIAQSASVGADSSGDIFREGRSAELRLGRGLGTRSRSRSWDEPAWYFFAASEDEAITWAPGASRTEFGGAGGPSFALQDQVEIGDIQAGITYETGPLQASLAYVEREVSVRTAGSRTLSQDESFTGITLTMRR